MLAAEETRWSWPAGHSHQSPTAGRCQHLKSLHLHITFPSSPPGPQGIAGHGQSSACPKDSALLLAGCLFPHQPLAPPCPKCKPFHGLSSCFSRSSPTGGQAVSQPREPWGRHPTGTATLPGTPNPTANQPLLLLRQGFWLCTLCLSS